MSVILKTSHFSFTPALRTGAGFCCHLCNIWLNYLGVSDFSQQALLNLNSNNLNTSGVYIRTIFRCEGGKKSLKGNISHHIHNRRKEAEIKLHHKFGVNMYVSRGSIFSVCTGSNKNMSVQSSSIDLIRV